MYFSYFPTLLYTLDNGVTGQVVTDILRRVDLTKETKESSSAFYRYDIKEGESPEILAHKIYGDTNLHWIILHTNEIIDPASEWPKDNQQFLDYLKDKYGEGNIYAEHHKQVVIDGEVIITDDPILDFVPQVVTNYDYEYEINEEKRQIKILKPRYAADVVTQLRNMITK